MSYLPRPLAILSRSVLAAIVSVIAGLLIAGLLLPLIGGVGLVARAGANVINPTDDDELAELPLGQRSKILAADGQLLAEVTDGEDRILTTIGKIPAVMEHALLAIEDDGFYRHAGLDLKGVIRALWKNHQAGEVRQGASTLTQQYVKNRLLLNAKTPEEQNAAREQTTRRKLHEARLALNFERKHSKDQILEKYFNIAYFGNGVYGVATAAQFYFNKKVEKLTLPEAALLAGLVQSPSRYDPIRQPKDAKARRDVVLARMATVFPCQVGATSSLVTPPASAPPACYSISAPKAIKEKLKLNVRRRPRDVDSIAPYFLDYIRDYLLNRSNVLGKTKDEREKNFFRGGLTIKTTLDPRMQRAAQRALERTDIKNKQPHAAIAVVEPGTGAIKAMAVNLTPKVGRGINLATGGEQGMEAGSTFKIFVLAAAIEQGIPLKTRIHSPGRFKSKVFRNGNKPYEVTNASGEGRGGSYDLITGTHQSVNTFYLQLAERTGIKRPVELARAMMGRRPSKPIKQKFWEVRPAFIFGTAPTNVLDVANAYATIAARGMACSVNGIAEIRNARNKAIKLPRADCYRAISEDTADTMTYIMRGVIDGRGTGRRANIGRPAAGKTGSAQENRSAFFAGFTPQYAAAAWMGNSKAPAKHPLKNVRGVGGLHFSPVFGGTYPAIIWQRAMSKIHEGLPVKQFPRPPSDMWKGSNVSVPDVSGMSVAAAMARLKAAGLSGYVVGGKVGSAHPEGQVAHTTPVAGSPILVGSSVGILISNGKAPPPPDPGDEPPDEEGGGGAPPPRKKKP